MSGTYNVNSAPWWLAVPQLHRNIFRGKYLGDHFTDEQKAAIAAGTFDDLYLGDYWIINGVTWRIVDIDYWYGQGSGSSITHHVVVMPDKTLYSHSMNGTNTTDGGYAMSEMYIDGLAQAREIVSTVFGANVLNHSICISNKVTDGHVSGYVWVNSNVDLCNEWQLYGAPVFTALNDGKTIPLQYTIDMKQFALMQSVPFYINPSRQEFWLRDVVSSRDFARVYYNGTADFYNASYNCGVRPCFGVTGVVQSYDEPMPGLEIMGDEDMGQ